MTAPKPLMWKISSESMECTVQGPSTSGDLVSVVERSAFEALEQRLVELEAEVARLNSGDCSQTCIQFIAERKVTAVYEAALRDYQRDHVRGYVAREALAAVAEIRGTK